MAFDSAGGARLRPEQERLVRAALSHENLAKSIEEVAAEFGIGKAKLGRWMTDPGFLAAYRGMALEAAAAALPEVVKALVLQARKGSVQHIRLFLDLVGAKGMVSAEAVEGDAGFESEVLQGLLERMETK